MCSMRQSTRASRPAIYERYSTDSSHAVERRSPGRPGSATTAPNGQEFLATCAWSPQFRGGGRAHDVDDLGGAAVAALDAVAGLGDRHGAQAQSAFGGA